MKKITLYTYLVFFVFIVISCTKSEPEFKATDSTFFKYSLWTLHTTTKGPNPSLGAAHAGNDSTVTRKTYFYKNQARVNGSYPIGTVIVKHASNASGTFSETIGMVKRGNNFNSTVGNWEWFILNSNGTIAKDASGNDLRGGEALMGGMCNSCHVKAPSGNDFTFTK